MAAAHFRKDLLATPGPNNNVLPSSSPAFATPVHPIIPIPTTNNTTAAQNANKATTLPVLIPAATLRPLAFRVFTKKHNLTLTSSALQLLATCIGRHCGSGWRDEGLGEKILDEVAKSWKKDANSNAIVDGQGETGERLKSLLKTIEGSMVGGRIVSGKNGASLSRQSTFTFGDVNGNGTSDSRGGGADRLAAIGLGERQTSFGMSSLDVDDGDEEDDIKDPRSWLKVVSAFDQPRLFYNPQRKHFEAIPHKPSLFPSAARKTDMFRHRYQLIHQRLLRNESFQKPPQASNSVPSLQRSDSMSLTTQQSYSLTPIANLLGRDGSSHLLLGLLAITPTGSLAIHDLSGSIALDVSHCTSLHGHDSAWFCPGMIVLIDGVYEEDPGSKLGVGALGNMSGVGGTIGGRFLAFTMGHPPPEKRAVTLGIDQDALGKITHIGGGFGWVDFLGVGSEKALGPRMRRLEQRLMRTRAHHNNTANRKIVLLGEVQLDQPRTLEAVKKILTRYASLEAEHLPLAFILMGNFSTHAALASSGGGAGGAGGSVEYKEGFNALASIMSDFPQLLRNTTWIFVPGDHDAWASAASTGASVPLPQGSIPELFTLRVKRAMAAANAEKNHFAATTAAATQGEVIWTTNPSRISVFGPSQEIVLLRDDMLGRLRRTALRLKKPDAESNGDATNGAGDSMDVDGAGPVGPAADALPPTVLSARKLVRTLLDQSYLAPFPVSIRPVHWDYAATLTLYPLPSTMVLMDTDAPPFALTYEGCHVMNPGRLVREGKGKIAGWVEYDIVTRRGEVVEEFI